MSIVVTIHLEQTEDEPRAFVWWGESDAVAGFSAAADHLLELITRAQEALAEVAGDSKVGFLLTDFPPVTRGPQVQEFSRSLRQYFGCWH